MLAHYSSFALFLYCHSLFWAAFILAAWLGGFTLPGVVQNSYKKITSNTYLIILLVETCTSPLYVLRYTIYLTLAVAVRSSSFTVNVHIAVLENH